METFDQSLKHLLEHEPLDFVRFALKDATVELIKAVAVTLPSRGRAIDGGHRVRVSGVEKIAHTEFQRRHQSQSELAVDVAEAQIRMYRREDVEEDLMQSVLYQEIFAKGELKGKREGKREGELKARASSLLELLELRGIPVSAAIREEIEACRDLPTLEHWFRRAAKFKTAAAVIRSRPVAPPESADPSER